MFSPLAARYISAYRHRAFGLMKVKGPGDTPP
jgi:hypothetical protein